MSNFPIAVMSILLSSATVAATGLAGEAPASDHARGSAAAAVPDRPFCFGRFVIDVPAGAVASWGATDVSYPVEIAVGQGGRRDDEIAMAEARLRSERFPMEQGRHHFIEIREGSVTGLFHVVGFDQGYEAFRSVRSFMRLNDALVAMDFKALKDDLSRKLSELESQARRTSLRADDAIPSMPGQCIEHGFVADEATQTPSQRVVDQINIGFRLKQPAGVHLSISITNAVNDRHWSPTLGQTLDQSETPLQRLTGTSPFSRLKVFRRKPRDIGDWKGGFEFLTRLPPSEDSPWGSHDFWYRYTGRERDRLHPHVEIRMWSGLPDNDSSGRRFKPSLTDAQAVELWNQLTASIRPRPVRVPVSR